MIVQFFIALWLASGIVGLICGTIWFYSRKDIFGIIALICIIIFIIILILILLSVLGWTVQSSVEWLN